MKIDIRSLIRGMESIFQDLVTVEVELCNLYARAADLGYATRTKFEAPYWVSQSFIAYPTPIPMPNWNKQK